MVLSVVTLLIWTTRIRNIWTDDSLDTAGQLGRTALSLTFTALALAGAWLWWDARRRGTTWPWGRSLVRVFALWTTGVWVVRGVQIATAEHSVGFVVVHTVLAVGSIALAWWADRAARAGLHPDRGIRSPEVLRS
jgi:hypothetical protein